MFSRFSNHLIIRYVILICAVFYWMTLAQTARADNHLFGSYQNSCRAISAYAGRLTAQCKDRGGHWRFTQLDNYRQCVSEIANDDGSLRCSRGAPPPGGNYTGSCRDVWQEGTTLHAACKTRGGNWNNSALTEVNRCVGNIANDDGQLHCNKGSPAPPGGYTQSCRDRWMDGRILHASCKDRDGKWHGAILDVSHCVGDISNQAGVLRCNRGGAAPAGSYHNSCRDIWIDGVTLHASCKDVHGGWVNTALDASQCHSGVSNIDGRLSCIRGAAPAGSYQDSCRDIVVAGTRMRASCRRRNGGYVHAEFDIHRSCASSPYNLDGYLTCVQGGSAPKGSYFDSCREIAVNGNTLSALCGTASGGWRSSTLSGVANCVDDISNQDGHLQCDSAAPMPATDPSALGLETCCSSPVPTGLILTNTSWSPVKCGNNPANMCFYQRYDQIPVGGLLRVCSSAPTPNGWVQVQTEWDPITCAAGTNPSSSRHNVKVLRRVQ